MASSEPTHRAAAAQPQAIGATCEPLRGTCGGRCPEWCAKRSKRLEILLQIWDEMDDWLAACRQALKRSLI